MAGAYSVDYSRFDDIVDSDDEQSPAPALPKGSVPPEAMPPDVQRAAALMRQAQLSGDPGAIREAHNLVQEAREAKKAAQPWSERLRRPRPPSLRAQARLLPLFVVRYQAVS